MLDDNVPSILLGTFADVSLLTLFFFNSQNAFLQRPTSQTLSLSSVCFLPRSEGELFTDPCTLNVSSGDNGLMITGFL